MPDSVSLSIEISEGDIIKFNDVVWEVEELPGGIDVGTAHLRPINDLGKRQSMDREELEERLDFSGEIHLIREDYREVIDF